MIRFSILSRVLITCVSVCFLFSCGYRNKNILFKTEKEIKSKAAVYSQNGAADTAVYLHRIKPDDRIVVNILNNYDLSKENALSSTGNTPEEKSFLVDYNGVAALPMVGRVQLGGLSRPEAAAKLEGLYAQFIKNPVIQVSIVNLSVSVLGEVKSPGTYKLDKEHTSLPEVLAMAGGPSDYAKLKNITIIRGDHARPELIKVNLGELQSLSNPRLIIHDKDIIYVEPSRNKLLGTPLSALSPYFLILSTLSSIVIAISVLGK